ncbi:MAG: SDR family oxidoreductase [Firmicutes bacterium]|nr:SDR family oxidoreductase [Bacillota bacterium]
MELGLDGKYALVVGGSSGIGLSAAAMLLNEGANVLLCSRNNDRLAEVSARLEAESGRQVPYCAADVTKADDVERLAAWVRQRVPALNCLIFSVGGSRRVPFEDLTDQDWLDNYEFNVLSAVRTVRTFLPQLKKAEGARVVIVGAASAKQPHEHQIVSNVHKAGLLALTRSLANEYAAHGILVNSVLPGRTLTRLWEERARQMAAARGVEPEDVIREFAQAIPLGRFGRPEEVAAMAVFLCSRHASYITGQSITVDGGLVRAIV